MYFQTSLCRECFAGLTFNVQRSTGPNIGSHDTNRTAAGVASNSGMRLSAHRWFSAETPSHTFGRGKWTVRGA